MNRRTGLIGVALVTVLVSAWLRGPGTPEVSPQAEPAPAAAAPPVVRASAAPVSGCATPALFSSAARPVTTAPDRTLAQLAYSAPGALAARVGTEPGAGIALYQMLAYCSAVPNRDAGPVAVAPAANCPVFDPATVVRRHRVELLQQAARLGSLEAKLLYLDAAPAVADEFRLQETDDGKAYARALLADAEAFGQDAAHAGSAEAMRFMSAAYASGLFGPADPQRAYLFALPLQTAGTIADRTRLAELGARLSEAQRRAARQQAFGCQDADGGPAHAS
ncbi:hypothetical protein ASF61_08680 [Duganella sp. Leaf126]|uniref:hypothetical protein n=1 Tax=Duganella sp. Leaf126 TaxID=1736266 RepID=UPI00070100BF|nr:hypothetical protein [Duganella sp. Leaf126]KQQ36245.1 hypothetical protein ASF61_08680 [Duganella sp. Leaf126]